MNRNRIDARSGWSDSEHNIPKAAKQLVTHMTEDSQQFGTRTSGVLQYAKENIPCEHAVNCNKIPCKKEGHA
ncbi:uncharacterized protein E5676_scaffold118G00180 [Cucumis melo var. makuwa]|uniref:Uncharacterized protein n=1 Tax=Cucumis melo var. makuwa TaxID=1194695 RepID=A0A5D3C9X1_CUCMM|nr:uncharacterized protein E5676_scaffold118G00180 [Cucumis melo var. makuwa]